MGIEPNDLIVLGIIKEGVKKFDKILNNTKIEPEEQIPEGMDSGDGGEGAEMDDGGFDIDIGF